MGGSETSCLLDALITDPDFPFVTNSKSVIAILKGIFKPHRPKGSGTSRNDEHARKEAKYNRMKQLEEEEKFLPPEFHNHVTCQAKTNRHRTFEEQVKCLAAYKAKYGDCHVKQSYKDDTELALWVKYVRQGHLNCL